MTYLPAGDGASQLLPLPGTCANFKEYYDLDTIDCLIDKHCKGEGFSCVNQECRCPEGETCTCLCSPGVSYCDGQTAVVDTSTSLCTVYGPCEVTEAKEDCAAKGQICKGGSCVEDDGANTGGGGNNGGGGAPSTSGVGAEPSTGSGAAAPAP